MNYKKILVKILFAVSTTLLSLIFLILNVFSPIDNYLSDTIYQKPQAINQDIVIIGIDEESIDALGKYESWNRGYYAKVIENLTDDPSNKPLVIGVDVTFVGESDPTFDQALVDACANASNVVLASKYTFKETVTSDGHIDSSASIIKPFDALDQVSESGFTNTIPDSDNYIRKTIVKMDQDSSQEESFALKIFKRYALKNGFEIPDLKANKEYNFDYYSIPGKDYTYVSFLDVYEGRIPNFLYGSICLIGAYTSGLQDDFLVPISRGTKMNGVEIHANIIESLTYNTFYVEARKGILYITYLSIIFIISFFAYDKKLKATSIMIPSGIALFILLGLILRKMGIIYHIALPVIMLFVLYLSQLFQRYIKTKIEKEKVLSTFKQYVPREIVDKMSKEQTYGATLGGVKKEVACLFVDIRGFTKLSEQVEPEIVVSILNKYLGMVTEQIFKNGGMLDKYVGDAVMAVFNAPTDLDDYCIKASRCALDILNNGKSIQEEIFELYGKTIEYGVGVNVGDAVIGNIGCDFRMDYTAIGDTINTAARLEANASGGQVLISEELYERIKDRFCCTYVGPLQFKNKANPMVCYQIEKEL